MDKFQINQVLGDGTYGSVVKATSIKSGEVVAIKQMKKKFASWDECINLREIKCLRKLNHPNLIKLKEVVKVHDELNLVFEYFDQNIYQLYSSYKQKKQQIPENVIRSIIQQIITGLAYMHRHGYFHRDLKPENLLIHNNVVKIIDFGLAREIRSKPPYTDYVSTRWYRAPELLVRSTVYNSPVDIFAVGCIMAELYMLAPIFCGNSELDQLNKILQILGTPTQQQWPDGHKQASKMGIAFQKHEAQDIEKIVTNACPEAITMLKEILQYDPAKRPTAAQLLKHPYFVNYLSSHQQNLNNQETDETQKQDTKYVELDQSLIINKKEKDKKNDPTLGRGFGIQNEDFSDKTKKNDSSQEQSNEQQKFKASNAFKISKNRFNDIPKKENIQQAQELYKELALMNQQLQKDNLIKPGGYGINSIQNPAPPNYLINAGSNQGPMSYMGNYQQGNQFPLTYRMPNNNSSYLPSIYQNQNNNNNYNQMPSNIYQYNNNNSNAMLGNNNNLNKPSMSPFNNGGNNNNNNIYDFNGPSKYQGNHNFKLSFPVINSKIGPQQPINNNATYNFRNNPPNLQPNNDFNNTMNPQNLQNNNNNQLPYLNKQSGYDQQLDQMYQKNYNNNSNNYPQRQYQIQNNYKNQYDMQPGFMRNNSPQNQEPYFNQRSYVGKNAGSLPPYGNRQQAYNF